METIQFVLQWVAGIGLVLVPALCLVQWIAALFSPRVRMRMRQQWMLHASWLGISVVASLVILALTLWACQAILTQMARQRTVAEMKVIEDGLINYRVDNGAFPDRADNATIVKMLEGDHPFPRKYAILGSTELNLEKEFVDGWRLPFRIRGLDAQHVEIRSAGPDQKWDTADDIVQVVGRN